MEEKLKSKKTRLPLLWILGAILITVCVSAAAVVKLQRDLYNERAYNSERIMNKIAANIRTVVKTRVDRVNFDAEIICDMSFENDASAAEHLKKLEDIDETEEGRSLLLLIDEAGNCLSSDGTAFRWGESGLLHTKEQKIFVSSVNPLGLSEEQMMFLTSLPKEVKTNDRTFTHLCLVMDQSVMARFLSRASYVEGGALFMIQDNGTYIYKQAEGSAFANAFNLLSKLKSCEYHHETTAELTENNIKERKSGCSLVTLEGENYFVVYEYLGINDWTAVNIVPESGAGGNSGSFMSSIIITVVILAAVVTANVIALLLVSHFNTMKQQAEINEQLKRAMEAEKNANDAKTRFLSSMSHDIRTPMNAIIGMTAIAENHIREASYVKDCLDKIHFASDHLLTLVNDILDISKIESGKMILTPAVFSLADSVGNVFNIVRPQAKAKEQILNVNISANIDEYLFGDELRLNQIFINILTNAVKYTPEGGKIEAFVELSKDETNPENARLTFVVSDNGIGMTEEFMENMYGSFSRATDSRINKIQGSGLGLSICKQLVDMMNGSIECESEPGKGSKFTVTVTLPTAEKPTEIYKLTGLKILLADDDEIFLEIAEELFKEMEAELVTVKNGHKAFEMIENSVKSGEPYSVILMDWQMEGIDGIETLRRLRSIKGFDTPVYLVSAYDSAEIEQEALDEGAAGFIRKPFLKVVLYNRLCGYLPHDEARNSSADVVGMNILMAEDMDINWEVAHELLAVYGINTERAENGKKCVERLNASPDGEFNAVLMDVQMPVMDGKTATRTIRNSEREYLKNIPIIAITADAFNEDIRDCLEAGMNAHISKPIDFERLLSELQKIRANEKKKGG